MYGLKTTFCMIWCFSVYVAILLLLFVVLLEYFTLYAAYRCILNCRAVSHAGISNRIAVCISPFFFTSRSITGGYRLRCEGSLTIWYV